MVIAQFAINDATSETAFVFGELYLRNGAWKFRAVGQGYASGLAGLATDFGITVDDAAPAPTPAASASAPTPAAPPPAPVEKVNLKKQRLVDMEKRVAATSPQLLSLTKKAGVSLEKRGLGEHTARVALCLDISGSMGEPLPLGEGAGPGRAGPGPRSALRRRRRGRRLPLRSPRPRGRDHEAGQLQQLHHQRFPQRHPLESGDLLRSAMELVREHYFGSRRRGPRRMPTTSRSTSCS